ncbi:MAG: phospholipase D-like domain-containing protein [Sandaracinaceae bacterium]
MRQDEIDGVLAATLDDRHLSRGEKHAIKQLIVARDLDPSELAFARHRAFELARERMPSAAARELVTWLEEITKALHPPVVPAHGGRAEVHFSPGPACLEAIARHLAGAKRSVDICVFTITDDRLARGVVEAHRRGAALRVITDDDKARDLGSDIFEIAKAGIEVRVDHSEHHMHHKFALFDRETVVTGSYNWTRTAATYNRENLLVTDDERFVAPYQRVFDDMWGRLAP